MLTAIKDKNDGMAQAALNIFSMLLLFYFFVIDLEYDYLSTIH